MFDKLQFVGVRASRPLFYKHFTPDGMNDKLRFVETPLLRSNVREIVKLVGYG